MEHAIMYILKIINTYIWKIQKTLKSIENKLTALLALTALSMSGKGKDVKLEVLLKGAGLEVTEIAKVLSKNEQAVRKMIMRAK